MHTQHTDARDVAVVDDLDIARKRPKANALDCLETFVRPSPVGDRLRAI